ncbi:hypothetical protein SBRY_70429 [Actinacidiphila bryophytorum]|uniref:Uncharacterized protein n=1 Tax=Actinacidiphila bryophytorum TaxID=1436133 RepID=A0A9W4H6U0_9ACTN|nr:hypothetical protein SBRY_70429 [Actinacidiphila bryophytorum]
MTTEGTPTHEGLPYLPAARQRRRPRGRHRHRRRLHRPGERLRQGVPDPHRRPRQRRHR